jgi:serine/threonine protein kinase, bacterial
MSLSIYPIIKKLGEGGFGTTYLATNTLMPSQPYCVVKQLTPTSTDPKIQQLIKDRFKQEAITLENLGKDSNGKVPSLYAYFVEQGEFYLIQEYVDGQTLNERVQTQGLFTELQVRQLLTDILPTLIYVHQRGIVHRDIKPENIMLCHRDNKPILIDFGAVKETMSTAMSASGNTTKSIVIGTPGFMPIEQMSGRPMFASDIYALGLTAIYLLTGKMPAEIETDPYSENISWQSLAPSISPQLAEVLNKAIQPSSRDRYKNAQEMLQELNSFSQPFTPSPTIVSPIPNGDDKTVYVPIQTIVTNELVAEKSQVNPLVIAMIGVIIGGSLIAGGLVLGKTFTNSDSQKLETNTSAVRNSSPSPGQQPSNSTQQLNRESGASSNPPEPDIAVVSHYKLLQNKQLDTAWDNLSPNFRRPNTSQGLQEYKKWWNSVNNLNSSNVKTLEKSESQAVVYADISYQVSSGKMINDENKYIYLIWSNREQKWLIDRRSNRYGSKIISSQQTPTSNRPHSWLSSRYVSDSDLTNKAAFELDIMRNSIYASHGRMFQSKDLQNYFNNQSWYQPLYKPNNFPNRLPSSLEQRNTAYIFSFQERNNLKSIK